MTAQTPLPSVLLVDDEANLLAALRRQLRSRFHVTTAESGKEALELVRKNGPFAVIVSDMRMPEMTGVELLSACARLAPDSTRIMLTGNADQQTAIDAVNQGHVYRFLNKPCDAAVLAEAIGEGVERFRLIDSERRLLEETLGGAVKMLMDVLTAVDAQAFGRAAAMRRLARALCLALSGRPQWDTDIAVMLAPVGWVGVPKTVAEKAHRGLTLEPHERAAVEAVPQTGYALIRNIPRLDGVAAIVRDQFRDFDGGGYPADGRAGEELALGARILRVLNDLFPWSGRTASPLMRRLDNLIAHARDGAYDPIVLAALREEIERDPSLAESGVRAEALYLPLAELEPGDILLADLETIGGRLLLSAGQELSEPVLGKLRAYAVKVAMQEPIEVERLTLGPARDAAA